MRTVNGANVVVAVSFKSVVRVYPRMHEPFEYIAASVDKSRKHNVIQSPATQLECSFFVWILVKALSESWGKMTQASSVNTCAKWESFCVEPQRKTGDVADSRDAKSDALLARRYGRRN